MVAGLTTSLHAQALGWEGETGVFVTPLAYTASDAHQKIHPVVAYHYFNAGPVIGDFHETSIEVGIGKRVELGYTHEFHTFGNDPQGVSFLWQNGFDIFNGKVIVVPENYRKNNWVPAVSVGFMARTGDRNVGNYVDDAISTPTKINGKSNADFYLVASKTVPVKHAGPLVATLITGGMRATNAELWGMGGNTTGYQGAAFGSFAVVFKGPSKSLIAFASEAAQQPHHPKDFPTLNIPTTLTYAVRVFPTPKQKLNLDFGVAQIAGEVIGTGSAGLNLKARHQVGAQVSYGF
jgi:hypothetical protein